MSVINNKKARNILFFSDVFGKRTKWEKADEGRIQDEQIGTGVTFYIFFSKNQIKKEKQTKQRKTVEIGVE